MGYKHPFKLAILPLLAGSLLLLTGCPFFNQGLTIHSVYFENQTLSVGGQTQIRVQASTMPGRKITYTVRAERGRILTGDPVIDQNQQVTRTERETFTYVAPFTSRYPDALGNMVQGDKLTIIAEDGFTSAQETQALNLSGDTMVYVKDGGQGGSELWAATVGEGGYGVTNTRQLKDRNGQPLRGGSPAIAPDGRQVAFVYYPGTGSTSAIYTLDSAGFVRNVTGDAGRNVDPSWAPSSRELAFVSDRADGNFDLYLVTTEREGNTPQRLTSTKPDERYPAFNPSLHPERRSTIAVSVKSLDDEQPKTASNVWNLYLYDLNAAKYRQRLTQRGDIYQFALEPKWRSDGIYLAYTRNGPNVQSGGPNVQRIYVLNSLNSGEGYVLNPSVQGIEVKESSPVWNPNGTEIAYLQTISGSTGIMYRQLVSPTTSTSEYPRIWQDFSTPVPSMVYQSSMNIPLFGSDGLSLDWR